MCVSDLAPASVQPDEFRQGWTLLRPPPDTTGSCRVPDVLPDGAQCRAASRGDPDSLPDASGMSNVCVSVCPVPPCIPICLSPRWHQAPSCNHWTAQSLWNCPHRRHLLDTLAINLNFHDSCPQNRVKIAIFGHQIGHKMGWTAQNHTRFVSGDAHSPSEPSSAFYSACSDSATDFGCPKRRMAPHNRETHVSYKPPPLPSSTPPHK